MGVNISIKPIKELNTIDKEITDDIRLIVGMNESFNLNIEYK